MSEQTVDRIREVAGMIGDELAREISQRRAGYIDRMTLIRWQNLAGNQLTGHRQWAGAAIFIKERYTELLTKYAQQNDWPVEQFESHLTEMSETMMSELEKLDPLYWFTNPDLYRGQDE